MITCNKLCALTLKEKIGNSPRDIYGLPTIVIGGPYHREMAMNTLSHLGSKWLKHLNHAGEYGGNLYFLSNM